MMTVCACALPDEMTAALGELVSMVALVALVGTPLGVQLPAVNQSGVAPFQLCACASVVAVHASVARDSPSAANDVMPIRPCFAIRLRALASCDIPSAPPGRAPSVARHLTSLPKDASNAGS
jgi:hypothetical protein